MAPYFFEYPLTNITNTTNGQSSILNFVQVMSDPDPSKYSWYDYLPGLGILLSTFIIVFFYTYGRGSTVSSSLWAASLVNFILAVMLYPLGVLSGYIFSFCCILLVAFSAAVWFIDNSS